MRQYIITIAMLILLGSMPQRGMAQISDRRVDMEHIESMLDRSRWGDAYAALVEFGDSLDPITDNRDVEWTEYHKALCAMKLGMGNFESLMERFIERYPQSIYANKVSFLIACATCDKGDLSRAKSLFEEVDYKALDSRERERYDIRVGYIRFTDGEYEGAKEHFQKIATISEYYPHALYYTSYIAYVENRNEEAEKGFVALKRYQPYDKLAPFYLLQLEYRKGNYDNVITEGERLLPQASGDTRHDLVRIVAESYFIKGDYANAIRYIAELPEDKCSRQEDYIHGYSLYRMARYKDAVEPLKRVCGADDELTQNASYHLGDCYLRLGNKSSAADAFAMASTGSYDENIARESLLNYGRLKYELGGGIFNEAINVLQEYLVRYPNSIHAPEVKRLLVAAYYNSKDYDAAYKGIREIPNPDDEIRSALQKVAVFRAVKAIGQKRWEEAEALLNESKEIGLVSKYNALTLYWLGEVAYQRGDAKLAKSYYEDYIRRAPKGEMEYFFAHYGLGYVSLELGDMAAAQSAFQSFVRDYTKRDSYLYDAHNRLGDAHYAMREFSDARKVYNVVAKAPVAERYYALYQIAKVDGIDNKPQSKIEKLKSIVTLAKGPYVDDAWYELGKTYLAIEQYKSGATTLQSFVDKNPQSPYYIPALSDLALAYYNLGRKDDARKCYERVVDYDSQSAAAMEAIRGIREIYVSQGDVNGYFEYAERKGLQGDMSIAARDSLSFVAARNLYLAGDMGGAKESLNSYLKEFDQGYNRTEALFYLSDCYVALEDNDAALATMRELLDHGTTQYTERVLDVYSRMSYDMSQWENAAKAYRQLYDITQDGKRREVIAEGYVDATLKYATGEQIISMADDVATMSDVSSWARRASMLAKANILREQGKRAEALEIYNELAADRRSVEGAEAYFRLVEDDFLAENYEGAEQRVYALGECGSMYWQAKVYLLLGDILVKQQNTFQARATYQSIVDGYTPKDDGIVDEAKSRIAALPK
ncbi:MAG: tetratricopeptide repeat protein [Alistipes sp.]|nr:tetratricopeptide repeat protein [Alistipes sp.]